MEQQSFRTDIRDGYTLLSPKDLDPSVLDGLLACAEKLLKEKKQDLVLSLEHIDTVFSTHLTAFVQLYRMLKNNNQRFIMVNISAPILNVMQMTQLESLFPIYLTLQDYLASVQKTESETAKNEMDFTYQINPNGDRAVAVCKGYIAFGDKIRKMQIELQKYTEIILDLSDTGYMDTQALALIGEFATGHKIVIRGASSAIRELFRQHHLQGKISYEED
jgi:anti-anti-sigma factor